MKCNNCQKSITKLLYGKDKYCNRKCRKEGCDRNSYWDKKEDDRWESYCGKCGECFMCENKWMSNLKNKIGKKEKRIIGWEEFKIKYYVGGYGVDKIMKVKFSIWNEVYKKVMKELNDKVDELYCNNCNEKIFNNIVFKNELGYCSNKCMGFGCEKDDWDKWKFRG